MSDREHDHIDMSAFQELIDQGEPAEPSRHNALIRFKTFLDDFQDAGTLLRQKGHEDREDAIRSGAEFIQLWYDYFFEDVAPELTRYEVEPRLKVQGEGVQVPNISVYQPDDEDGENVSEQVFMIRINAVDPMKKLEPGESRTGIFDTMTFAPELDESTGLHHAIPYMYMSIDGYGRQLIASIPTLPLNIMNGNVSPMMYAEVSSLSQIELPELEELEDIRAATTSLAKNGLEKSEFKHDLHKIIDALQGARDDGQQALRHIDRIHRIAKKSVDYVNSGKFTEDKMSDLLAAALGRDRLVTIGGQVGRIRDVYFSQDDDGVKAARAFVGLEVQVDADRTEVIAYPLDEVASLSF